MTSLIGPVSGIVEQDVGSFNLCSTGEAFDVRPGGPGGSDGSGPIQDPRLKRDSSTPAVEARNDSFRETKNAHIVASLLLVAMPGAPRSDALVTRSELVEYTNLILYNVV